MTSSVSTSPKSGLTVAVIWKLVDGRQNRSMPASAATVPSRLSSTEETKGYTLYCCRRSTPFNTSFWNSDRNLGLVNGSAGQDHCSFKYATLRLAKKPMVRSPVDLGMLTRDQGI